MFKVTKLLNLYASLTYQGEREKKKEKKLMSERCLFIFRTSSPDKFILAIKPQPQKKSPTVRFIGLQIGNRIQIKFMKIK